jgi:uncharacterized protein (TIGR03083 family)
VDYAEHVGAVERELGDLVAALRAVPLSEPVPTCPGWTLSDLVKHVGGFCGFWTHVLCDGASRDKTPYEEPPPEEDEARTEWFAGLGAHLTEALTWLPGGAPVWTWFEPDQTAAFVARRAANELAVHRYDAQSARGTSAPIERTLAADSIDEVFGPLVTARARTGEATGQTMHLHGTDVAAEWLVTLQPDRIDVSHEHAKGDLALRGSLSDLALLVYGRPTLGPVEPFGDEAVLEAWYREFVF